MITLRMGTIVLFLRQSFTNIPQLFVPHSELQAWRQNMSIWFLARRYVLFLSDYARPNWVLFSAHTARVVGGMIYKVRSSL